jgi:uncharacterized protein YggE
MIQRNAGMLGLLLLLPIAGSADGQENSGSSRISVTSTGEVRVKPAAVELMGVISAKAELAGDAITNFRSTKDEALATLKRLDVAGMSVMTDGLAISSAITDGTSAILRRMQRGEESKPAQVLVKESVKIRIADIDKLEPDALLETLIKVIDAAKEAGVAFGPVDANPIAAISRKAPPTYTIYKLADEEKAIDQASERAMQNARVRAERLATLAGGKLGRVLSVQEVKYPSYTLPGVRSRTTEISSEVREDIRVTVSLSVQFQLNGE